MNDTAHQHGRTATQPRGWWDIAVRVKDSLSRDNASLISAGLAMYGLLAIFPALAATVSIYGLLVTPAAVVRQMSSFSGQMPPGVWDLLKTQLQDLASHQHGALTTSAVIALIIALWSASSGMSSLMTATNIAYGERAQRPFLLQMAFALLFTIGALIGFILMLALAFAVPLMLGMLGARPWMQIAAQVVRWLLLWCFAVCALAITYRLAPAPAREPARRHWVSSGCLIAATLWLVGTVLLTLYVKLFAGYEKTYGALGGVVVLLMWFYVSSFVLVLGAEINAEAERHPAKDTSTGPEPP